MNENISSESGHIESALHIWPPSLVIKASQHVTKKGRRTDGRPFQDYYYLGYFTFSARTRLSVKASCFPSHPFSPAPTFWSAVAAAPRNYTEHRWPAGRATALPSRSKPVVMVPQREEHVGRPSARRQSCAAPRVSPTRCCSAPLSSGVGSGAAASTAQSLAPFSFETPPMTHPRLLRAHPAPFTRSSAPPHKCGACHGTPGRPARAAQRCTVAHAVHNAVQPRPARAEAPTGTPIDPCAITLHAPWLQT